MTKINFLLLFTLLFTETAFAQTSEELFKKVFGNPQEIKSILLDTTMDDFYLGGVHANVMGNNLISLSGADLDKLLHDRIRADKRNKYAFGDRDVKPSELPFKVFYSYTELRLKLEISTSDLEPKQVNLYENLIPYYARKAAPPAPFSFGTNYHLEETRYNKINQPNTFSAQIESFMNVKNVAIENQMNYLSPDEAHWYRQNTKVTYDIPKNLQRIELGDVTFPSIGYQQSKMMGGVSFYKDYTLNPYRTTVPTSSFEYEVETRSLVRTYVNNVILKTEYMNPGRYSVKDLPLNNGVNKIVIELTDSFGKKKVLIFNEASSVDALGEGLSKYSVATGYPSNDGNRKKQYDTKKNFSSAFYQYGVTKRWSAGGYVQGNKDYSLIGMDHIFATIYGNWSLDLAGTKNKQNGGVATTANYQLNLYGNNWYDGHTINSRLEYRSPWFNENGDSLFNKYDFTSNLNYSVPFLERFNAAIGVNYSNPRKAVISRYGFDTSLSSKIFNTGSLSFFYSRLRNDNRMWNTQLYFFFNITFGESSTFASAFYEKNSQTKRITVVNDDGKKVDSLKTSASIDESINSKNGSLDLQYNTALADVGVREDISHTNGKQTGFKTAFRFLSSFAYVNDGENSAFSISRPISNSFVIFKPNADWDRQEFGVQTNNMSNESHTGLFGESLLSGLTPYQYRRIQLDPSRLAPGYSLGQESFVVYPHFRSGHIFMVGKSGMLVLQGILLDKNNNPVSLKMAYWTSAKGKVTPFFTGRDGEFFVEGIEPSIGTVQVDDDNFKTLELNLQNKKSGMYDIGKVIIPFKENRL